MVYSDKVSYKIEIINELLQDLKVFPLHKNSDFILDSMSNKSWVRISWKHEDSNGIPVQFILSDIEFTIGLDRISEAIDFSNKDIKESEKNIKLILRNLFTSFILVDYRGLNYTRIRFFNSIGKCTNTFKYMQGFTFFNRKSICKLYNPLVGSLSE